MSGKKYQVFVSSTFSDLKDERQAVSKAILNLGHIPAGMELFPAADMEQMTFIRRVIDDCDYYLLIIGGRYGSISDTGLSFTELEYQYAVEKKKPILAFIHNEVSDLKSRNVDTDPDKLDKLNAFRDKVKSGRLVEFWSTVENLESKSLVALTNAFNEQPQTGWRRDTEELSLAAQKQIEILRQRHDYWRDKYEQVNKRVGELSTRIEGYEALKDAIVEIRFTSKAGEAVSVDVGAESIIREFAAMLPVGLTYEDIHQGIMNYLRHKVDAEVMQASQTSVQNIALFFEVYEICSQKSGELKLLDGKKWLLKAAFRPLGKVLESKAYDDDIPF